jgi:hypothetical protein
MAPQTKTPIWERPNPKKRSSHLTPGQKKSAAASARRHGRSRPGLVENINAKKKK